MNDRNVAHLGFQDGTYWAVLGPAGTFLPYSERDCSLLLKRIGRGDLRYLPPDKSENLCENIMDQVFSLYPHVEESRFVHILIFSVMEQIGALNVLIYRRVFPWEVKAGWAVKCQDWRESQMFLPQKEDEYTI